MFHASILSASRLSLALDFEREGKSRCQLVAFPRPTMVVSREPTAAPPGGQPRRVSGVGLVLLLLCNVMVGPCSAPPPGPARSPPSGTTPRIVSSTLKARMAELKASPLFACASPANEIVRENCQRGAPSTEWDVNGAGDWSIQGFASDISFAAGEDVRFFVKTDSPQYRLDIYRMGFYNGSGARLVDTVRPHVALPQQQPPCRVDNATLLYECSSWNESARWHVSARTVSGLYFARLTREDPEENEGCAKNWRRDNSKYKVDYRHFVEGSDPTKPPLHGHAPEFTRHAYGQNGMGRMRNALREPRASHVFFVVRDDAHGHDILVQTSDTTWQAYNGYGGFTTYGSFDHPYTHGTMPVTQISPCPLGAFAQGAGVAP